MTDNLDALRHIEVVPISEDQVCAIPNQLQSRKR